jgi:ABC-2 type transport system permease protein
MTAATTRAASGTAAGRTLALATTEVLLILRNKTMAVSALVLPLGLGVLWAFQFGSVDDPARQAVSLTLQLSVALAMGVYPAATQTLVARRHARVLKRMRTSGLTDGGLLVATLAPSVVLGVVQLAVFALVDVGTGAPPPTDVLPLVLAVPGGLALAVTAALATSIVTPSPERAQITTLPLMLVMLGVGVVAAIAPGDGWWPALMLVPGAALGELAQLAMTGGSWAPPVIALIAWPLVLGALALRHFPWDPRH